MRLALWFLVFAACGGGGSNPGGGDDDDMPPTDGPVTPMPDTPTTQPSALGTTCTPDAMNPQGSCPAGFQCLNLQGATNAWCSKTCTVGAGDTCATDYSGPGKASCILTVTPEGGGASQTFCSVICADLTSNPANQLCPANQCNNTCPGSLACSGDLMVSIGGGAPMVLGKVCE